MKHIAKYFQAYDHYKAYYDGIDVIQKQCQHTLYPKELCSIQPHILNNSTTSQNIGNFQQQTKEALQNSQIDEAFEIVRRYVMENKNKFIRFYDTETEKIIIGKQLCRFDEVYIIRTKKKLSQLKYISGGQDIMHITLTLPHSENSDYIENFHFLKEKFGEFVQYFKRCVKKNIDYVVTYEVTEAKDGLYHQHLHLIIINQAYLDKKIFYKLKNFWRKITGSKYLFFKYISRNRNIRIFDYVFKYVQKEIANINLTSVILFSIKGRAYTMALSMRKKIKNKTITIKNKKYLYINTFDAEDIFVGYSSSDYHPAYLTCFFAIIPPDIREKLLKIKSEIEEQKTQIGKIEERDAYWNAKNSINNIIKIK